MICFTYEYHYLDWKERANEMGVYFGREINNRLRGVSRIASLDIILERIGPGRCSDAISNGSNAAG